MKRHFALTGIALAVCALACAQDSGRVVVPARNGSRPRIVDIASSNGSITVKTYDGHDVIVETGGRRTRDLHAPEGMRRIDIPDRGLEVEEQGDTVRVRDSFGSASFTVSVPVATSLHLRSTNGSINVDGVHGEIDAEATNGSLRLTNVSGSVLASTNNSKITVTMDGVDASKPSAFSTLNGSIDVTLPADLKAHMKMTADNGSIYSDFDVTVSSGGATTQANNTPDGRYRLRFDRTLQGTINGGGGADLTFRTTNGSIVIRKKK